MILNTIRSCLKKGYLADDKKDFSPAGMEIELASRSLDVLNVKCWILCVGRSFTSSDSHIALTNSEESLQWLKWMDTNVSVFWLKSLHTPSTYEIKHATNFKFNNSISYDTGIGK